MMKLRRIGRIFFSACYTARIMLLESGKILRTLRGGTVNEILILCHAIERGMGMSDVKIGFGKEKATRLIELLKIYASETSIDYTTDYTWNEACSVLRAYFAYQNTVGADVLYLEQNFNGLANIKTGLDYSAGFIILEKSELEKGLECDFKQLVESRHSVRSLSPEAISEDLIQQAVAIAIHAPSSCNRQPCKVYYSVNKVQNKRLSKLVSGNKPFADEIPYYCVITSDRALFGVIEAYQWFLDAGIFISHLILAFHSLGIGSCVFQWPNFFRTEKELKKLIGLKNDTEAIAAVIGFGHYKDETKCIFAQRKPVNEVIVQF